MWCVLLELKYVLREANFVVAVDALARPISLEGDCRIYDLNPNFIHINVIADVASISFPLVF